MDLEVTRDQEVNWKLLVEVPRLTRRRHDTVVTTGLGRQRGALPTEGHPSLSLLAENSSNRACGMHSMQHLAPGETGVTRTDPLMEEKAEAWRRAVSDPRSHSLLVMKPAAVKWPCHCSH